VFIRDVLGSNLGQNTSLPDGSFSQFSSDPLRKYLYSTSSVTHRFIPKPFHRLIYYPTIRHYIILIPKASLNKTHTNSYCLQWKRSRGSYQRLSVCTLQAENIDVVQGWPVYWYTESTCNFVLRWITELLKSFCRAIPFLAFSPLEDIYTLNWPGTYVVDTALLSNLPIDQVHWFLDLRTFGVTRLENYQYTIS
jgi:hypothetical protein